MKPRRSLTVPVSQLFLGVSVLGMAVTACNKQAQPTQTEAAMVAPPSEALPLATGAPPSAAPAPPATALPAAAPIPYVPRPPRERYGYIDRAYSMGQAFADTPPDYAVDYQGTRPWIWRSGNGAYRVVEMLPQGERDYFYQPGQDQPFLVRDPDYSYAYDNGALAGVYGPNGAELDDGRARQHAYEASRYLARARELHRAALYEQRQSAYADAWAARRDQLRREDMSWREEQARNAEWRSWHEAHAADEQRRWQQEQRQRAAYAVALGLADRSQVSTQSYSAASGRAQPNPAELAQRQAAYFSNWKAAHGQAPASQAVAPHAKPVVVQGSAPIAPGGAARGGAEPTRNVTDLNRPPSAAAQTKAAQALQAEKAAADAKQREAAAAQAKAAQAAQAQTAATEARQREAALTKAKEAEAAQAQKAAAEAKQHEAEAAKSKAAQSAHAEKLIAEARQRDAAAAQAKAAHAAQVQKSAAEAKQRDAEAAQAKAAQAAAAERAAAGAKQREAAAAQAKAAQAAAAEKAAAGAKQREALAAKAKSTKEAQAAKLEADAKHQEAAAKAKAAETRPPPNKPKHDPAEAKDRPGDQPH